MNRICILLLLCFLHTSCTESEKEKAVRLVKEWDGKEIRFPSRSVFTVQGKDTVDFSFRDAPYKVVSYVDSVGCTSCKLQLSRWKTFMHEVDSLVQGHVPFAFYFHPKDLKELRYILRRDAFTYPVCFDETDELNRLNRFPGEMTFQTFLLNKDNKVVALGNPVHNPQVKELYLQLLTGKDTVRSTLPVTEVSIDTESLDFGSFPWQEQPERTFVLTNTGKNMLVLHDVVTSCGCTRVAYAKEPIRPGEQLKLKVTYAADQAEHFSKTVTVYCNASTSPLRLKITGNAR